MTSNMVENPDVLRSLCVLLHAENAEALLSLSNEHVTKAFQDALTEKRADLSQVLTWTTYLAQLRLKQQEQQQQQQVQGQQPPQQPHPALGMPPNSARSSGSGPSNTTMASSWISEFGEEPQQSMSKIMSLIRNIPLPDNKCYQGYADTRSITWYINRLSDESRLHGLHPKSAWLLLTSAFAPTVRGDLLHHVQSHCRENEWMVNFTAMLERAVRYLREKYARSDDPTYHESRLFGIRQQPSETLFQFLDRVTNETAQGRACGLSFSRQQICMHFRRGLIGQYARVANLHYASIDDASDLACQLDRYFQLNPHDNKFNRGGKGKSTPFNGEQSSTDADAKAKTKFFSDDEFKYAREKRACFTFAKTGSCSKDQCAFAHIPLADIRAAAGGTAEPITTPSTSAVTTGPKPATSPSVGNVAYVAHSDAHGDLKKTVRSPDLRQLFVEIDTGCSVSLVTSHAEEVLQSRDVVLESNTCDQDFTTASGPRSLHADHRLLVKVRLVDLTGEKCDLLWRPYVVSNLPECDGLLGKDAICFGERGLEIMTNAGNCDLAQYWCSRGELDFLDSLPPCTNITCSNSDDVTTVTDGSVDFPTAVSQPNPDMDDVDEALIGEKKDYAFKVKNADIPIEVPDFPTATFAPVKDPLLAIVMESSWYRITLHQSIGGSKYFLCDFSKEYGSWLDSLQVPTVPHCHWRWAKADDKCRRECTQQLDNFIAAKKLVPVSTPSPSRFRSNFYGILGRKRYRVVTPLVQLNHVLRLTLQRHPITNPQRCISVVVHRLRASEMASMLDVKDAFMCLRCGEVMASKLQIFWKHNGFSVYQFMNLIYGSAVAPLSLEYVMAFLEASLPPPSPGLPLPASYMDDIVRPRRVSDDCQVCDKSVELYADHGLPLTVDHLESDVSHVGLGMLINLDFIMYRPDKFEAAVRMVLPPSATYRNGLRILGLITNMPDCLPLHILPLKHTIIGLLSAWRSSDDSPWDSPMPEPLQNVLLKWLELVKGCTLPKVPRRVDMDLPLSVFTDSSKTMQCYRIYQGDDSTPLFQDQFVLSVAESHNHINVLELSCVWHALSRLQLIMIDTGLFFTSTITVCVDSKTALSILMNRRVPRGPFQALNQKYLDLVQVAAKGLHLSFKFVSTKENPADDGTRHPLLLEIHQLRAQLQDREPPKSESVMPVRTRAQSRATDVEAEASSPRRSSRKRQKVHDVLPDEAPVENPMLQYDYRPMQRLLPDMEKQVEACISAHAIGGDFVMELDDSDQQVAVARLAHSIGHEGVEPVYQRLKGFFKWPNMKDTLRKVHDLCDLCARTVVRPGDNMYKQPASSSALFCVPFTKVGLDVLGPFDDTIYVCTLCCYYTGYLLTRVCDTAPTNNDIRQLINKVYRVFGYFPDICVSDNATYFEAAASSFPGEWTFSPLYASNCNGLVERRHRCINQKLRRLSLQGAVGYDLLSWQDLVDKATGEINNAPIPRAKNLCPIDIITYFPGVDLLLGLPRVLPDERHEVWNTYRRSCVDRTINSIPFTGDALKVGQKVMVKSTKRTSKLSPLYTPATITKVLGDNRVELDDGGIHHSKDLKIMRSLVPSSDDDDDDEADGDDAEV
ncbi:hypothetical protein FOZ63_020835, partial [Perkinsus olseni]